MENNYLLLIDGSSLLSTQYYGNLPRELMFAKTEEERQLHYDKIMHTSKGIYTNAIYGFMRTFLKILKEQKPTHIAVAWDVSRNTFRREIDKEYKGTRSETPEPLKDQFKLCQEILKNMNVPQFMDQKYEADDFCGSISKKFEKEIPVRILTKDNDYLQLVSEDTRLWLMFTTQDKADALYKKYDMDKKALNLPDKAFELTPELVKEEFGIRPDQVADLKSLVGDKSDNIKGVSGVGETSAVPLIAYYETVEKLYEAIEALDKNQEKEIKALWKNELGIKRAPLSYLLKTSDTEIVGKESAMISKKLAIIKKDIDLGDITVDDLKLNINVKAGNVKFTELEFKSLSLDFDNEDNEVEEKVKIQIKTKNIEEINELNDFIKNTKDRAYINYSFTGDIYSKLELQTLYISNDDMTYILEMDKFNLEEVYSSLKNLFENEQISKVVHDGKILIKILKKHDIDLKGMDFDTAIASYIIDSSKNEYKLESLCKEYLNIDNGEGIEVYSSLISKLYEKLKKLIEEEKMEELFYDIEMPLVFVLAAMEGEGIKVDQRMLEDLRCKLEKEIEETQRKIYDLADEEFNINSPKQLGKILFEKLDLRVIKKTKTGYSTNADVLEKLKNDHPIIPAIMYYRQIAKLNSTYVEGLKNFIDEDGYIHTTFNQTVTTTGRLSSTDPNLQNIPIKYEMGREIRKVFIPKEKTDIILSCDYSQIELRVLAHMSDDENMINSFKHHSDIHRKTASEVFNVDIDEVTPLMRSRAKAVNFGIVYGMGDFSLSQDLKITRKEAAEYMKIYFDRYPKIKGYLNGCVEQASEKGYVTTIVNRRRYIPEIMASNKIVKALGERLAMNAPIQGSAADIIKIAMIKVFNRLKLERLKSTILLQVHDELILNVKKDEIDKVRALVKEEMENAVKLKVPMDVDINEGSTWYEAK